MLIALVVIEGFCGCCLWNDDTDSHLVSPHGGYTTWQLVAPTKNEIKYKVYGQLVISHNGRTNCVVMQLVLLHHGIVKHMVNQSFGVIEGDIAISLFLIKFWKDDTYCPLVFSNHGSLKNTMRRLQFINYLHFRPDDECSRSGILLLLFCFVFLFLFCFFACVWVLLFFVLFFYTWHEGMFSSCLA